MKDEWIVFYSSTDIEDKEYYLSEMEALKRAMILSSECGPQVIIQIAKIMHSEEDIRDLALLVKQRNAQP